MCTMSDVMAVMYKSSVTQKKLKNQSNRSLPVTDTFPEVLFK